MNHQELDYSGKIFEAEGERRNAYATLCSRVHDGGECPDVDTDKRIGEAIASFAHAAKLERYCVEAAISDCSVVEDGERYSMWDGRIEAAEAAEDEALRLFAAWLRDDLDALRRVLR